MDEMDEMDRMDEMDEPEQHAPPNSGMSAPILLGGGSGHTGSRLLRRLLGEGRSVAAITRSAARLDWARGLGDLRVVEADLRDPESPARIAGALAAHFPAGANPRASQPENGVGPPHFPAGVNPDRAGIGFPGAGAGVTAAGAYIQIANIAFAERAVEIARAAGLPRLICMSSTRRFTRFPDPVAERVIAGEAALERASTAGSGAGGSAVPGLAATILRPSMIYGGARDNNLEKLVRWLERPVLGRFAPVTANGRALMQPIFVDDLVDAIIRALDRPAETSGRALTLAGPEPVSWRAMIEMLAAELIRAGRIRRAPWVVNIPYPALFAAAAAVEGAAAALAKAGVPRARALVRRDQVRRLLEDKTFEIAEAREALGEWTPRSFAEGARLKITGWDQG